MKRILFVISTLALLFSFVACNHKNLTLTGKALSVTDYSATLTGYANLPLELGDAEVGIMYDKGKSFENAQKVVATDLDGNNMFTVTATQLKSSTKYYYKSYVQNGMVVKYGTVKSFTTKESIIPAGAVDLGIVMTREDGTTYKLYWAECNVGASKPEEYGYYYAWGETMPKSNYSSSTYKWCNGDYDRLMKYNTDREYGIVDNKVELEQEDDVAHKELGGKWRMPTDSEWKALRNQCYWKWTRRNNVNGYLVTADNGNSIFLPAAGFRNDADLNTAGFYGYYWSSSLYTVYPYYAWYVYFCSVDVPRDYGNRCFGFSIRPVSE